MIYLYFLIFFLLVFSVLLENDKTRLFLYIGTGITLFLIAAFRDSEAFKDYTGYIEYYDSVLNTSFSNVEPSFILITHIVDNLFADHFYLFVIYAFLGIFLKFYAINKLTKLRLLSVLIYFSGYFFLFEMTQIRAGIAGALLLLCIKPIKEKKAAKFFLFATLAFFFHYSAIIIFPLYFLDPNKLNQRIYFALIPLAYILYFLKLDFLSFMDSVPIDLIRIKYMSYHSYANEDNKINLFNFLFLSRCLLAFLFLWKWKLLAEKNDYSSIMIKIYVIGLFIFITFAGIPGISSRTSELLTIVEIVLIPLVIYLFKEKYLALMMVVAIGFIFLNFYLFYGELFIG